MARDSLLVDYLQSREETLSKFHPQWNLTTQEIDQSKELLKRDGTPICIPPSWDLLRKYAGSEDKRSDGFDENIFKEGLRLFTGDRSEAEFLDVMRNLKIGGILVGDVRSEDLSASNDLKVMDMNNPDGKFQIDFLYFHQSGIYHFEIKTKIKTTRRKKDDTQMARNQEILQNLFVTFCQKLGVENAAKLWGNCYFRQSAIFYMRETCTENQSATTSDHQIRIRGKEELKKFWIQENNTSNNLFKCEIYRNFLLFFAGLRPDYFISPLKCAAAVKENIFTHHLTSVNYYRKMDSQESKIQNDAKNVIDFLKELQFVKSVKIDFGEYSQIYLTKKQQEAVGFFDDQGLFSPKRQIILGPPGSGKSLILMLKVFILGQMERRKEKKLYYWNSYMEHMKKLRVFIEKNKSKFCREVKEIDYCGKEKEIIASEGNDFVTDEAWSESDALTCLSAQHDDQIVALVFTGKNGCVTSRSDGDEDPIINVNKFESLDFKITELSTVFRSTCQIQKFFHKFNFNETKQDFLSGHNFDGIKVEQWIFENEGRMKKAVKERIWRLIEIEGCKGREIGFYQPRKYKKPPLVYKVFNNHENLRSLEFPVMIVVEPEEHNVYLVLSRAICHLIVFQTQIGYPFA